MKYYEIVRLANQWPDMGEYEEVKKLLNRGWNRKALDYLSNWDYGEENIGTAIALGEMRDTILDPLSRGDRIVYEKDGYHVCESHCPSGLYDAIYLVRGVDESDL